MRSIERMRAALASHHGYMMLDVLAALTVFSIVLVGFVPMLITTTQAVHQGKRTSAAATLARDKVEEIRATPYAAVASGYDSVADAATNEMYDRRWVVGNGPAANTRTVQVVVDWQTRGAHRVEVETIVAE